MMRRDVSVRSLIKQHGSTVEVLDGLNNLKATTKAMIQPSRYVDKNTFGYQYLKLGIADINTFIYTGMPDVRIDTFPIDTILRCNGDLYTIKRAEKICLADEVLYIWAILQKYVPDDNIT